jgi:hypothetical protein
LNIIESKNGQQYAECRFENLVGIFPMRAIKLLKKSGQRGATSPPKKKSVEEIESQKSKLKLNERKKKQNRF